MIDDKQLMKNCEQSGQSRSQFQFDYKFRKNFYVKGEIMAEGRPIVNGNLRHVTEDDFGLSASPSIATKAMFDMEVGGCPMRANGVHQQR